MAVEQTKSNGLGMHISMFASSIQVYPCTQRQSSSHLSLVSKAFPCASEQAEQTVEKEILSLMLMKLISKARQAH